MIVNIVAALIEESYHENNSYHNIVHASDVTQAMHCYLQEDKVRNILFDAFVHHNFHFSSVSPLFAVLAHRN